MSELFITLLSRIHKLLAFRAYYRWEENGNVRFHSLDGKWQGGAQLSYGKFDREVGSVVPYPDGPRWEAFVFAGGNQRETGFANLAEAEAVTRRLLRTQHGPYLLTERKYGGP